MADVEFSGILEKLNSPEKLARDIETDLPELLVLLENEEFSSYFLQIITTLLGPVLDHIDVSSVDKTLLREVLPCVSRTFENNLVDIINKISENCDEVDEEVAISISSSLQIGLDVLNGFSQLVAFTSKCHSSVVQFQSLHRTLPSVLVLAFTHCRDSQTAYGPFFNESSDILLSFFKKSYDLQTKYYKILESNTVFSTSHHDVDLLSELLEKMCSLGDILVALDSKTVIDQWKYFTKLCIQNADSLRERLNIVRPITLIATATIDAISVLTKDDTDAKAKSRALKTTYFLLKILEKLCEKYKGVYDECMRQLVDTLHLLYSSTINKESNASSLNEQERAYLRTGAESLLSQILDSRVFYECLASLGEELNDLSECTGFFFFLLELMKSSLKVRGLSELKNAPLLRLVLTVYDKHGNDINQVIDAEGNAGYSKLVTIVATHMISSLSKDTYPEAERLLIEMLLNSSIHTSVFISDLFCLIGRLTSDQYCLDLAIVFSDSLKTWPHPRTRPEYTILGVILSRFFNLLTPQSQSALCRRISPEQFPEIWKWFRKPPLDSTQKQILFLRNSFHELILNKTEDNYNGLVKNLINMANCLKNSVVAEQFEFEDLISNVLLKIFHYHSTYPHQNKEIQWADNIFHYSLSITEALIPYLNHQQLTELLKCLTTSVKKSGLFCSVSVLLFLKGLSSTACSPFADPESLSEMINLFESLLLQKDNPLVEQLSLEVYSYFSLSDTHERIAEAVYTNNGNLQQKISNYLEKIPVDNQSIYVEYIKNLKTLNTGHTCDKITSEVEVVQLTKKPKVESSENETVIIDTLLRLSTDLKIVKKLAQQETLSSKIKEQISTLIDDAQSLRQHL